MDSRNRLVKLFYGTPRAQEIYSSLCHRREAEPRISREHSVIDIPDKMLLKKEKDAPAPEQNKDFKVEFDESLCSCDEPTVCEILSECESKVSEAFQKSLLQEDQKQRELLKWSIRIVNDNDIIVEGQRSGDPPDISWRTSVICERVSTNVIRSRKGTLYFLLGEISEKDMIEKCFSDEITKMFKYGFPPNWRDVASPTLSYQRERKSIVHNEMKTPIMTKDKTDRILREKTNTDYGKKNADCGIKDADHGLEDTDHGLEDADHGLENADHGLEDADHGMEIADHSAGKASYGINDKASLQADKLRNRMHSNRKTRIEDSSKTKKASSKPSRRNPKRHSSYKTAVAKSRDSDEIEVQRTRSGRIVCPVLEHWRGQRICTSPNDGEITVIKSNLEENLKMTLVETSRNSSGLLHTSAMSSGDPTSGTNYSKWVPTTSETDSTNSMSTRSTNRKKSTKKESLLRKSLRSEIRWDETTGSDTDNDEYKRTKKARARRTSRNKNTEDQTSESETSAVEQEISKDSNSEMSEKIPKTAKSVQPLSRGAPTSIGQRITNNTTRVYPKRAKTPVEKAKDSDSCTDEHIDPERQNAVLKRSYPRRTSLQFNKGEDTHSNSVRETNLNKKNSSKSKTQSLVNDTVDNFMKSANSRRPQRESQAQHAKRLKGKLSSKTGTLARKRELRDMLEQQDEGYEDDAFEGTPFKNQKISRTLRPKLSPVDSGNLVDTDDDIDDKYGETPNSRTPTNRLRPAGPLSTGKSENDMMTPGLLYTVKRSDIDRYVNQLKRQKVLNMRKKVESRTPLTTKKTGNMDVMGNANYSFNIQKSTMMEDEEDEDYYWSDNE